MAKILAICAFIMLTSPTSTHALMDAGYDDGIEPLIAEGEENALADKDPIKPAAEEDEPDKEEEA